MGTARGLTASIPVLQPPMSSLWGQSMPSSTSSSALASLVPVAHQQPMPGGSFFGQAAVSSLTSNSGIGFYPQTCQAVSVFGGGTPQRAGDGAQPPGAAGNPLPSSVVPSFAFGGGALPNFGEPPPVIDPGANVFVQAQQSV